MSLLQGCNDDNVNYCPDVEPVTFPDTKLWQGINSNIPQASDTKNKIAVACHNCYDNNSSDALDTFLIIESAIESVVDIVELDIVIPELTYQQPMVSHELDSTQVPLESILSNQLLQQSNTILFLEIKGKITNKQYIRDVLDVLMTFLDSSTDFTYFNRERFVALRSFEHLTTLRTVRNVLNENKYSIVKPFIKLSSLHFMKKQSTLLSEVKQSHQCGMNLVEFDYRLGVDNIMELNNYAESLGLAVNVFTIDDSNYQEAVSSLKNSIDVITVNSTLDDEHVNTKELSLFERVRNLIVSQ